MMQSKIESLEGYKNKNVECDCIWLLKEIQGITHRFEGTRNVFISLDDAWSAYYSCRQGKDQTLHEYLKVFQGLVQVLEHYGAAIGAEGPYQDSVKIQIMSESPHLTTGECNKQAIAFAKKKSVAIGFLKRANRKRFGGLWSDLENLFTRGQDDYPSDLTGAYNLLLNYKAPPSSYQGRRDQSNDYEEVSGITFLQNGTPVAGSDGATHSRVKCFTCHEFGHYASVCPTTDGAGSSTTPQDGVQLLHQSARYSQNLSPVGFFPEILLVFGA